MDISKIVNEAIAEALKEIPQLTMQSNQPPPINQPQPQPTNHHYQLQTKYHIFENSHHAHHQPQYPQHPQFALETPGNYFQHENTPVPNIDKFNGKTDALEFIEDLDSRFILQPNRYPSKRLKVMATLEHMEGTRENVNDSPKQWARVELLFDTDLLDNWPAFR